MKAFLSATSVTKSVKTLYSHNEKYSLVGGVQLSRSTEATQGIHFCGFPGHKKIAEINLRIGYQQNRDNESYYWSDVYYVRHIFNTFSFNLHRSSKMQVFSILLIRKPSLRELKGSMNFQTWNLRNPRSPLFLLHKKAGEVPFI